MPTDPGRTISWVKTPSYTTSLLNAINNLPSRQDQHALFCSAIGKTTQWKTDKANALATVTAQVFDAGGDQDRAKKQRESTQRRITQLGKVHSDDIALLKADPYNAAATLGLIQSNPCSFFDLLRPILHDHPDFPPWDPNERYEDQSDFGREDTPEEEEDQEDDLMQDVQHAPLAGPAYPNPLLPHHAPYLPPAPIPLPPPAEAPQQPAPPPAPQSPVAQPYQPPPPPAANALAQGYPDEDEDELSSCPVCSTSLSALSPSASEAHLRTCLDSSSGGGATVVECPVCGLDMSGADGSVWTERRKERHVGECCEGAVTGGVEISEGGGRKEVRRGGVRDHALFPATERTVPKDSATGEALECIMCFDSLLPSNPPPTRSSPSSLPPSPDPTSEETLARLSCHCVFHSPCIREYWEQFPGRWCPTHREMDEDGGAKGEVEMR
ncbi:hypothetical protein JCM11251_006733 [Rhodosporidiobolus azoricus]